MLGYVAFSVVALEEMKCYKSKRRQHLAHILQTLYFHDSKKLVCYPTLHYLKHDQYLVIICAVISFKNHLHVSLIKSPNSLL